MLCSSEVTVNYKEVAALPKTEKRLPTPWILCKLLISMIMWDNTAAFLRLFGPIRSPPVQVSQTIVDGLDVRRGPDLPFTAGHTHCLLSAILWQS